MTINNEQEFKQVLAELSVDEQRILASQFVESVVYLNPDPLIESDSNIIDNEAQKHRSTEAQKHRSNMQLLMIF